MFVNLIKELFIGKDVDVVDKAFDYAYRQQKRGKLVKPIVVVEGGTESQRKLLVKQLLIRDGVTKIDCLANNQLLNEHLLKTPLAKVFVDADQMDMRFIDLYTIQGACVFEGHEFHENVINALKPAVYLQFRNGVLRDNFDLQAVTTRDDRNPNDLMVRRLEGYTGGSDNKDVSPSFCKGVSVF
ncbi:hypothetical protein [Vibrio crassostreae]|uniref:hypothetical protein n=1 Tax=Vibrio crassostreae TaxID=246167 RepID=UPI001B30DC55|nr:hypothetical protein [Vibrio crassostreae]